jgi:hypothetical protein
MTIQVGDFIQASVFIVSLIVGYFGVIRNYDNRIVRLETKYDQMQETLNEIKQDVKKLLAK